jgi:Holliday junction resolvase-like predicted endonuclease
VTGGWRPWEVADRHRELTRRYKQLRGLGGGVTPQQRGSQLNYLLADVLRAYEIQVRVSQPTDLGEIDVAFRLGETRIILEAKWTRNSIGFGPVSLLATRARQRLEGTIGVFASMAGYTAPALDQVSRSGERVRVVLFDGEHVEALIGGLASPYELIDPAPGEASVTGRTHVGVAELLASHDRPAEPPIGFGPPESYDQPLIIYAAEERAAEIVLHCPEEIRGIAVEPDGRLLVTLPAGMAEVDLEARSARWAQGPTWMDRNPHVDPAGRVWVLRGAAVARLDGSRLRVVAGGFGGASTLFAGPGGVPWVLDRSGAAVGPYDSGAQLVRINDQLGDEECWRLRLPASAAMNAAALGADRFFVLGSGQSARVDLVDLASEKWIETPVANPQGLAVVDGVRLLAVGDKTGVTLVEIDAASGDSADVMHLRLSGSVSEIARPGPDLYVRSQAPVGQEAVPVVLQIRDKRAPSGRQ